MLTYLHSWNTVDETHDWLIKVKPDTENGKYKYAHYCTLTCDFL